MLHRPLHIYGAKDLAVDLHVANIAEKFFRTIAAEPPTEPPDGSDCPVFSL